MQKDNILHIMDFYAETKTWQLIRQEILIYHPNSNFNTRRIKLNNVRKEAI